MVRFREIGASWIKSFEGDFGRFIHHEFRIEDAISHSEFNDINNINIFPNPANDELTLFGNLQHSSKLILRDNLGRIIKTMNLKKNVSTHKIDISHLSKGIYFLSIDNVSSKKIIKQ